MMSRKERISWILGLIIPLSWAIYYYPNYAGVDTRFSWNMPAQNNLTFYVVCIDDQPCTRVEVFDNVSVDFKNGVNVFTCHFKMTVGQHKVAVKACDLNVCSQPNELDLDLQAFFDWKSFWWAPKWKVLPDSPMKATPRPTRNPIV